MRIKSIFLGLVLLFGFLPACAQKTIFDNLDKQEVGQGTVVVYQDSRLKALVGNVRSYAEMQGTQKSALKVQGFRVQVYAGNNSQQARTEANNMAKRVKDVFPEWDVYAQFISPRWVCRVGDFRSIEEADAVMRQLKATGDFKELAIVRSVIKL